MNSEIEIISEKTVSDMNCHECGNVEKTSELSPGVIDNKLKLVCAECWDAAVKSGRATIYTREELTAFSEFK